MENMPTTIDGWYKATAILDGQYHHAQAIANQNKSTYTPDHAPPPHITSIKDLNAMDIYAVQLMQEECLEHL